MSERRLCRLQQTVGVEEDCPEGRCPFWEPGGAVLQGRCAIDHVDLVRRPELASWLLTLRLKLEAVSEFADEA